MSGGVGGFGGATRVDAGPASAARCASFFLWCEQDGQRVAGVSLPQFSHLAIDRH